MKNRGIETPAELDGAASALASSLRALRSPHLQLHTLIAFYDDIDHLHNTWKVAYLLPHRRTLIRLLIHPYTQGGRPQLWVSAMRFLRDVTQRRSDGDDVRHARRETIVKGVLAHAYVSDLRRMHAFLLEAELPMRDMDEDQWQRIYGAGPVPFAMFESYCDYHSVELDEAHLLNVALQQWRMFLNRPDAVSVILLERMREAEFSAGAVLQMEIVTRYGEGGVHINNQLGTDADLTRMQLQAAREFAQDFAQQHTGYAFDRYEVFFQFIDLHAAFSGGSLGLATTVGLASHLSRRVNARLRWTLNADTSCIASLDAEGGLEPVEWTTIRRKLDLAFHSPLRRVVIPDTHREEASRHIRKLQQEFPQRHFEVYSASRFSDCFRPGHVVSTEERNPYDRIASFTRRHARTLLLLLSLLLLLVAGGLFYQSYVAFPNLEHVHSVAVEDNAIVYNPHDSLAWAFRDGPLLRPATVPFGELVTGDGFSRSFVLYNMTPKPMDVWLSIEGPHAEQWYINSGTPQTRLESLLPSRISLMYAPTASGNRHEAALVLRDAEGGKEYFRLDLTGAAGRSLPGGYALRIGSGPDYMTWRGNALAFTAAEVTVESWVRSLSWDGCLLHNGPQVQTNPEQSNLTISFNEGVPQLFFAGERFTVPLAAPMKPNQWHHIALSYSLYRHTVRLFLDGSMLLEQKSNFIMHSRHAPYVTLGAYSDSLTATRFLDCEIDNFRVWDRMFDETEVRRTMHATLPASVAGLRASFDMETNIDVTAFAGSGIEDAVLLHRPERVRSTAPVESGMSLPRLVEGPKINAESGIPGALLLTPGYYLSVARQLLPRKSDASFAFWWHAGERRGTAMAVRNLDHFISFGSDTVAFTYSGCTSEIVGNIAPGWHHVVIRVLHTGRKEIFIDGIHRGSYDPCNIPGKNFHDWHHRYEGITFGVFDDKYSMFAGKMHTLMHETLAHPRRIADIAIWRRLLCNEEITRLAKGADPPLDHLVAYWRFDHPPTADLNIIDRVDGQLLHIKAAPAFR